MPSLALRVQTQHIVTALLLAVAAFIALAGGLPTSVSWEWVAGGVALGLVAAFIDAYRMKALIEEGAQATVEYMSVQKPQVVATGIGTQMVEQMLIGFQKQMTKAMGKSLIAFERVIELAIQGTAAFCGLAAIAAYFLGWQPFFALGMWIILATLAVALLMKVSGLFSLVFGLFSGSLLPASAYTERTKQLIAVTAAGGIAVWLLYAMQWWATLAALGTSVDVITLFLLYALVTLFSFAPFSAWGIGWMELAAVLVRPLVGAGAAAAFLAVIAWEITRIAGSYASAWALETLEGRKNAAKFR